MSDSFFDNAFINEKIKKFLERKLIKYNDVKYAYAIMNKRNPANFTVISNRIDWVEFYTKNNFQFTDPVLITASNRMTPFPWDENITVESGVKFLKLFNAAKEYNIANGYTFVLHDPHHNLVVLSFFLDSQSAGRMENIEKDKSKLQMLLMTTHEAFIAHYRELKSIGYFEKINGKEIFSDRENDVLYLASMGKSYQEIALILGVKLTTIKYHIGNAVKKLGVTNAKHAIRLGVELQLIRPVLSNAAK
ncbi:LuxR family quorum-sensing system transcriptional regulator ExpR [Serratia fonticola]|uniref:LuxR family quorum-sensing system transcriptional regulator ExpR n=1 Tax=Serratia fonticola TaxID=47917 RepID=A0A542BHQ7_SERFO|nr:LuxR family transcriptional regulator [Serratia fonticola]TQI78093.1 LuxR family quorum-sensing system transcriptional regulator ExpR [Serratia fonticola]TQI94909.1 LuxR family quorum-sensing system transcriptional regulator ExpR [Serratia fonticola]TVZ69406.1 LuxR family quorum-sensing system transcriptional regulator ExpR [Serratia fonticola]